MQLNEIFKNSDYSDTQFSETSIISLQNRIYFKDVRGVKTPYVECLSRKREIKLTPEEAVRQLLLACICSCCFKKTLVSPANFIFVH